MRRGELWSCAEGIGSVPLLVRLLCTCPKKVFLVKKLFKKQQVSCRRSSLRPSHPLALFSSSVCTHKKTFLSSFFLPSRLLPPLPSWLLSLFVFFSVLLKSLNLLFPFLVPPFSRTSNFVRVLLLPPQPVALSPSRGLSLSLALRLPPRSVSFAAAGS